MLKNFLTNSCPQSGSCIANLQANSPNAFMNNKFGGSNENYAKWENDMPSNYPVELR